MSAKKDSGQPSDGSPRNEAELLDQESRLAQEALTRIRGEVAESLRRSVDLGAWAARYPWPTLGTAAVAGATAGWALGAATKKKDAGEEPASEGQAPDASSDGREAEANQTAHPASRMVSGLATLTGAFASAAIGAASQAVAQVVKESIHDTLRPPPTASAESDPPSEHPEEAK
jgi:hypothetical protein